VREVLQYITGLSLPHSAARHSGELTGNEQYHDLTDPEHLHIDDLRLPLIRESGGPGVQENRFWSVTRFLLISW
jgi:hypothetical protein